MRAIVDSGELYRALRDTGKGQAPRKTLPVLSNVLLTVEAGRLIVTRCDLETWAHRTIPVMGGVDGATTVPAKLLRDLAQVWAKAGPMLLESLVQEPLPFDEDVRYQSTAKAKRGGYFNSVECKPLTIRPAEHSLLVMVNAFGFTSHILAIDAEQFPPIPVGLEEAA